MFRGWLLSLREPEGIFLSEEQARRSGVAFLYELPEKAITDFINIKVGGEAERCVVGEVAGELGKTYLWALECPLARRAPTFFLSSSSAFWHGGNFDSNLKLVPGTFFSPCNLHGSCTGCSIF